MNQKLMSSLAWAVAVSVTVAGAVVIPSSESDKRIETSFKQSYVYNTYLKDESIKIEVNDGVVALKGSVAAESDRSLAEELASSIPGVLQVENHLETDAEMDAENADKWMGRKVKMALLYRSNVSGRNTTVDVKDGIVTLTGETSSVAQKELTTAYAQDIEGVIEVRNNMTVAEKPIMARRTAGEKIDDASVTAQVRSALASHRSTRDVSTVVTTRNGEVTLTGIAKNRAEKALVTKLVKDIHGVSSVKNEMTVAAPKTI